jgi:hypothetical protein
MKNSFIFSFLFFSLVSFAQNNYLIDKKGNKIIIRDDVGEVILIDKRISYTLVGKSWEKYIKFDDLDYAAIGPTILKSFKLKGKKSSDVYYIYASKEDKSLIGIAVTVTTTYGNMSSSKTFYKMYVIDNDNNILDEVDFNSSTRKSESEERALLAPMIRKHFSDCPQVIQRLSQYDLDTDKNTSIMGFFFNPAYINCK